MRCWSSITGWWRRKTADRTWGSRLRETRRRVTAGEILRQHTHNFTQTQILETFLDKYETRLEKSNFPPDRNHMGELTNPPGRRAPPPLSDSWSCCLNTKHANHCLLFSLLSSHSFTSPSFWGNFFTVGNIGLDGLVSGPASPLPSFRLNPGICRVPTSTSSPEPGPPGGGLNHYWTQGSMLKSLPSNNVLSDQFATPIKPGLVLFWQHLL